MPKRKILLSLFVVFAVGAELVELVRSGEPIRIASRELATCEAAGTSVSVRSC